MYDYFINVRWWINLFLVGIPFGLLFSIFNIANVYVNYELNQLWADGNIWLVFNTVF